MIGTSAACQALGTSRSRHYRWRSGATRETAAAARPATASARALAPAERDEVLAVLRSERFAGLAPAQVYAALLAEGRYLCSVSTMYRLLRAAGAADRRLSRAPDDAPGPGAATPNRLWLSDVVRMPGPDRRTSFIAHVLLDAHSRYVLAWLVAPRESPAMAGRMLDQAIDRHCPDRESLEVRAVNGPGGPPRALTALLALLGLPEATGAGPGEPFAPPTSFASVDEAGRFADRLFVWHNHERLSRSGARTAADVHYGRAGSAGVAPAARAEAMGAAVAVHPERFVRRTTSEPAG